MNDLARESLLKQRETSATRINKRRVDIVLEPGDRVLVDVRQRVKTTFRNSEGLLAFSPKIEQMLNIGPFTVIKKHTDLRYYLADSTGKHLKHSFHLNRLQLWRDALITPASVGELLVTNAEDAEIAKLIDSLYAKHGNIYTQIIPLDNNSNTENNSSGPTGGESALSLAQAVRTNTRTPTPTPTPSSIQIPTLRHMKSPTQAYSSVRIFNASPQIQIVQHAAAFSTRHVFFQKNKIKKGRYRD